MNYIYDIHIHTTSPDAIRWPVQQGSFARLVEANDQKLWELAAPTDDATREASTSQLNRNFFHDFQQQRNYIMFVKNPGKFKATKKQ